MYSIKKPPEGRLVLLVRGGVCGQRSPAAPLANARLRLAMANKAFAAYKKKGSSTITS